MQAERLVSPALDLDVECIELRDESDGVFRFELLSPAERQSEIARKPLFEPPLGLEIAQRDITAEGDEPFALDARAGRIAVDDPWKNVERTGVALRAERDPRPLANGPGEIPRADLDGGPPLQRREDRSDELPDFVPPVDPAALHVLPLASRQARFALGPEDARRKRDAVAKSLPRDLAQTKNEAGSFHVVDDDGPNQRLGRNPDRDAVESDVRRAREGIEHARRRAFVDQSSIVAAQRFLDRQVLRRGLERRLGEPVERKLDRLKPGIDLDPSFEPNPFG
jgi:hypothetical protein